MQTETEVQSQIKQYLERLGYAVYRINNGAVFNKARDAYVFHGTSGVSDLLALKIGQPALFIECKKTGGKPSASQTEFMRLVDGSAGVKAVCVDSLLGIIREGIAREQTQGSAPTLVLQ